MNEKGGAWNDDLTSEEKKHLRKLKKGYKKARCKLYAKKDKKEVAQNAEEKKKEATPGLYVADNKCLALATDSKKGVCSSDGKITFSEYSDTNCSTLNNTETHTSGECFPASASPDASPAARAVPFVFVLLSVILASMLMQ